MPFDSVQRAFLFDKKCGRIKSMNNLKKNDIFEAVIDGWSSDGAGVCHVDGRAVFVPGAIPGERWRVKVLKVTSSAIFGKGIELIDSSPDREEPACPYFGKCGGCDLWHMSYRRELDFKLRQVNDALKHIGGQDFAVTEIISGETVCGYRNKGVYNIANTPEGVSAGFYRERSHELVPMTRCLIQDPLADRAALSVVGFMRENSVSAYDEKTGKGTVRHVFTRKARNSGDAVVCIVSAGGFGDKTSALVSALRRDCPELTGIVLCINKNAGNGILNGNFYTLWGSEIMDDTLCGFDFSIAPQAFYQINPPQAERLYERAAQYAALTKDDTVLELYCGAGTISMVLAKTAGRVIGAEIVPQAVENAKNNAAKNGVTNAEFICADAGEAASILAQRGLRPATVVVDPPRKGMDETTIKAVCSMAPQRIVYVSCNPATLARDIKSLNAHGYTPESAAAVDMFPRTCHVETIVLLQRETL